MDAKTGLEQLRNDLSHMDNAELLAFLRSFRAQPQSDEHREAQAEWQRRRIELRTKARLHSAPSGPTSAEFSAMAAAASGQYPWKRSD
jgi:hypothetical protein